MRCGDLDDVVLAALFLFDGLDQLVVSDQSWWSGPFCCRQLSDLGCLFRFVPPVGAFSSAAVVCSVRGWLKGCCGIAWWLLPSWLLASGGAMFVDGGDDGIGEVRITVELLCLQ